MVRKATTALIAIVVMCLAVGPVARPAAHAEPAKKRAAAAAAAPVESSPAGYDEAISRAFRAFETSRYGDARAAFLEAHALFPNARTLRALGKTEYELSNYVIALGYLEDALRSDERPLTADQRAETQELLDQLRGYVARFTVTVRPANADVTVDDVPFAPRSDGAMLLTEGEHEVAVSGAGYQAQRHVIHAVGAGEHHLDVVLLAMPPVERPVAAAEPPSHRRRWAWLALGGVVVAGAITGAIIASTSSNGASVSSGTTGEVVRVPPAAAIP